VTIPTIIWLEDEADSLDTATAAITSQGVNIEYCNTPEDLVNLAEAITTGGPAADALGVPTGAYLLGFIVDVMLKGVRVVKSSDGTSQGTQDGYEAGLKVASLILRFADSPYNDVPLLVLSARSADAQQMNYIETLPGQVKPVFIEKFLTNWEKEVEVWVSALLKGREQ
jgi:hypothetical protein